MDFHRLASVIEKPARKTQCLDVMVLGKTSASW